MSPNVLYRPMTAKEATIVAAGSALAVAALFGILLLSGCGERYCYFYPSIDTTYAEGYSEVDFLRLKVGMSTSEVDRIMCKPLSMQEYPNGVTRVLYTRDGKAPIGDFAWFGRSLDVKGGTVTGIVNTIYYD